MPGRPRRRTCRCSTTTRSGPHAGRRPNPLHHGLGAGHGRGRAARDRRGAPHPDRPGRGRHRAPRTGSTRPDPSTQSKITVTTPSATVRAGREGKSCSSETGNRNRHPDAVRRRAARWRSALGTLVDVARRELGMRPPRSSCARFDELPPGKVPPGAESDPGEERDRAVSALGAARERVDGRGDGLRGPRASALGGAASRPGAVRPRSPPAADEAWRRVSERETTGTTLAVRSERRGHHPGDLSRGDAGRGRSAGRPARRSPPARP